MAKGKKAKPEVVQEVENKPIYHLFQMTTGDVYVGELNGENDDCFVIRDTEGSHISIYKQHIVARIDNVDPTDLKRSINAN